MTRTMNSGNKRKYAGDNVALTPRAFFLQLDAEFHFTLDAAASPDNALCARYFTEAENGIAQAWSGVVWCNPPYDGRVLAEWVRKAFNEARRGVITVMLVPVRTDMGWWHDYALRSEIRYIRGRMRFEGWRGSAPFASALLIFRPERVELEPHR